MQRSKPAAKKVPAKKTPAKKVPAKKAPARTLDDEIDDYDGEDDAGPGVGMAAPLMDGFTQDNQRSLELSTQMRARTKGTPVFPYPPELKEILKPFWLELVNSFPKEHFQQSDVPMMKIYCQCAYDVERQTLLIEEEGEVVMGARAPIVNPRCKVRESNRMTMMTISTKFRNQPASRMGTDNHRRKVLRVADAANSASAVLNDEDGLLAGGYDERQERELSRTRH